MGPVRWGVRKAATYLPIVLPVVLALYRFRDFELVDHPLSTYALRGRGVSKKRPIFADNSTDRLREKRTRGGEGVQNPENLANVINGCPLTQNAVGQYSFAPKTGCHRFLFTLTKSSHKFTSAHSLEACTRALGPRNLNILSVMWRGKGARKTSSQPGEQNACRSPEAPPGRRDA